MQLIKLRPYQEQLKQDIYQAWNSGFRTVLARAPTGSGKTVLLSSITADLISWGMPTAIEVHRKELVEQISLTLASFGIMHNIIAPRATILGIVAEQRARYGKSFYDYKAKATVLSVDTLIARAHHHVEWAKSIRAWIVDEAAHVLKVNKWGRSLEYFPNAIGLGVTATPERLDRRGLGSSTDGVFDVMVEGPDTAWMINNGYLSKYKIVTPAFNYNKYLKKASEGHDFTRDAMAKASAESQIYGHVVNEYIKHAYGKQGIVFASDISTATDIETEFNSRGIPAKLLTGETPDKERREALKDYRDKKTRILINVDLFDEGLDVPGIEVVSLARASMSLAKVLQMCGRGLRILDGKEYCIIIDHVSNLSRERHGLPCDRRTWTLERISKRRDKINLMRTCKNFICNKSYDRILSICPYCNLEDVPDYYRSSGDGSGRVSPAMVDGDLIMMDPQTIRELEGATLLEDPVSVSDRVSKAAGSRAGQAAYVKQLERIAVQKELMETIANWAGYQRRRGLTNRMINKEFYINYDKTITQALGEVKADMLQTLEELHEFRHIKAITAG